MPNPKDAKPRPLVKLEAIKGDEFLASNKKELMELFEMTKQHQQGDRFVNTAIYPDSELHLEDRDHSFARALQLKVRTWCVLYLKWAILNLLNRIRLW